LNFALAAILMSFVAFPMRLEKGFLRRVDGPSAVLALVEAMARTPHGSWPGSVRFGLRDYLEGTGARSVGNKTALDEMNAALDDLGIHNYRVESLTREQPEAGGSAVFAISLVSGDGQCQVFRITSQE
jgi:hypothetical protein